MGPKQTCARWAKTNLRQMLPNILAPDEGEVFNTLKPDEAKHTCARWGCKPVELKRHQVIPQSLRLSLVIALGTLAPKTNLRQMGGNISLIVTTSLQMFTTVILFYLFKN